MAFAESVEPALEVALLWALFAGTHVGLAWSPIRQVLVRRLGSHGFTLLFSLVAAATFTWLVHTYAALRFEGAAGLALGGVPGVRAPAMVVVGAGLALAAAGLVAYPRLPMALFQRQVAPARGIERVSRHAFFAGVALLGAVHALLATRLVGAVFMLGFAGLGGVGALHQDAKLRRRHGEAYDRYLAETSFVPFAAIASGRQRLVARELPWTTLLAGGAIAVVLRGVHASIFDHGGAYVVGAILAGASLATLQAWRAARRRRAMGERRWIGQPRAS